jgi:hypothetical protein
MRIALVASLLFLLAAAPAGADTFAVDNNGDADLQTCSASPNDCTLRGAINKANTTTDPDMVTLPAGRIAVTADLPDITTGDLTIKGAGARSSVIDGTSSVATVLRVTSNPPLDATIEDVQVTGAKRRPFLTDAAVTGVTRIERVAVVDNQSIGILTVGGTTITDTLVARNVGDGFGGIVSQGAAVVANSTIADNVAAPFQKGVGIAFAGGITNLGGASEVDHSTIAGNSLAPGAVPITGENVGSLAANEPSLVIRSSVIDGGKAGANCGGPVSSSGHNVESDGSCHFADPGDRSGVDPRLAPLADNGGPTDTIALLDGSPAIDAGDDCPATDQRGLARVQGATCDAGALESPFTVTKSPVPDPAPPSPVQPQGPSGTPPAATPPADTAAPKLTIGGIGKKVSRKALRKGLKVKIGADEPIAAELALIVTPHRVTVARVADLVLGTQSLARGSGTRTVRIKPARRPAGRRAVPAQLRVVAFDSAGNRAVKTVRFTIK